jgi:hypothetical protein
MPDIFNPADVEKIIARINALTPESRPLWGKMSVGQMLAHLCVTYDMVYDPTYPPIGKFKQFLLTLFIKKAVVGPKPYPKNSPTAPEFVIKETRDFVTEKARLTAYIQRVLTAGRAEFDGKPSRSFGPLSADEWNILFYKHLDHHLTQFGV